MAGEGGSGWEAVEEVRVRVERERGMAVMIVELLVLSADLEVLVFETG